MGLTNLGNTCFMNSAMQCLSAVPHLVEYFLSANERKVVEDSRQLGDNASSNGKRNKYKGLLAEEFGTTIRHMWQGAAYSCYAPRELKSLVGKVANRFEGYEQHDCQEFLRFFVDVLHQDLNRVYKTPPYAEIKDRLEGESLRQLSQRWWDYYRERQDSHISDVFQGQFVSHSTCRTCKYTSTTFDPFFDLSLPIPSKSGLSSRYNNCTIEDCLQKSFIVEDLSVKAGYVCSKCKQTRAYTKQIGVYRWPPVLMVHLKRFLHKGYRSSKISTQVKFGLQLDISQLDQQDMNEGDPIEDLPMYDLVGVANHVGSLHGGHYTADTLHTLSGNWTSYSDTQMQEITPSSLDPTTAYCFFYVRRNK